MSSRGLWCWKVSTSSQDRVDQGMGCCGFGVVDLVVFDEGVESGFVVEGVVVAGLGDAVGVEQQCVAGLELGVGGVEGAGGEGADEGAGASERGPVAGRPGIGVVVGVRRG